MTGKKSIALRKDGPSAKMMEICSVHVGSTLFGVPITHILEIVGNTHPHAVPLAPVFVGGLLHYRGEVLTTVSMRQLLGLPATEGRQDIMVLENKGSCFGLLVDSVGEVLTISAADREPNPSILDTRRQEIFAGACKLPQGLLIMLDPERLDPMRLGAAA
ncbi:chemotaxis protein CheW [Acidicapsa dinghuensis]|uniref:Chemotaxis protein CheW n=1 Tax=Acidicapsa dinghuensis TaxID=2218256 RepID=A0ABW1EHW4_9BACT|nr:chemotaxis protein CheW [Acidicapsa dinghuensis]